ncbi:MAG TPA: hypothetical protein VEN78_42970, partial [Bradyrhizobium sp.]|nr:hypothetical protein [Bradyrhizobium sp.]
PLIVQLWCDGYSSSPKWLVRLIHQLLPRQSEVVEEMLVIGKIAQRGALPAPFAPVRQFVQ